MLLPSCDSCKKPLEHEMRFITLHEIVFIDTMAGNRGARGLHFCDLGCCKSWITKSANAPILVQSNGPIPPPPNQIAG